MEQPPPPHDEQAERPPPREEMANFRPPKPPKRGKTPKSTPGEAPESEGARRITTLLLGMDVLFHKELYYHQCRDRSPLRLDFFVVVKGRVGVIEYDGRQHFEVTSVFKVDAEKLAEGRKRDIIKNRFLRDRSISLLRISYQEDATIEKWVTDFIRALESATTPVYRFSSPLLYINPFGDEPGRGICSIC
jgi:hypothetical protein